MSVNPCQSWVTANNPFFLLANVSTLTANNITANNISTGTLQVSTIAPNAYTELINISSLNSDGRIEANEFSSIFTYAQEGTVSTLFTQHIVLDQATLDVTGGNILLLNGIPIATTNLLSNLADWSAYPAICTLKMSGSNIENAGTIYSQNIVNSLNIQTDTASFNTTFNSPAGLVTNFRATNISSINSVSSNVSGLLGQFSTLSTGNLQVSSIFTNGITANRAFFNTLSTGLINGQPYNLGSNWSAYPATQTVQLATFGMNNTGTLTITASNDINTTSENVNMTADTGINIASIADINLTAQNGNRGQINLTANSGFNNGVAGTVNITANGGQVAGVGTGGTVNITANTPIGFSNLTSKISINASGVNSYAGTIPPIASLYGYNFIYGQNGVNICAGLPSAFPNVPFTTFLYGTAGVTTSSDFYCPNIYPYWDGLITPPDLNITGRYIIPNLAQVYVNLSNVKRIYMDSFAEIQNPKLINMDSGTISNANTITGNGTITGFTTLSASNVNTSNILASNTITVSSNIVASNYISTQNMNLSSINGFAKFGSKSMVVNGDVAQIQLSNNNNTGSGTILNLLSRINTSEIQSFNSNFTTPLPLFLNSQYTSTTALYASTINGQQLPYPYGSFTANTSQTLGAELAVSTIYDTTEIASGISIVGSSPSRVAVSTSGVYRWIASPQFDTTSGGQNTVDFWLSQNGTAIPRTASKLTIQNNGEVFTSVEVLTQMNAQDYIETCFTSTDNNMTTSAFPASGIVPAVPAVILNATKISD